MTRDPAEDLRRFARAVYGGCSGFVEIAYMDRGRMKAGHVPVGDFLDDPTPCLELAEQGRDVYLGCSTLSSKPDRGRGKSSLRLDLPGAWLDLDLDVEGHHKEREDGLRQLSSAEEAQEILTATGLPEPTALVASGGGLYAWWLYDEPLDLSAGDVERAGGASLSEAINAHVSAVAAERGIGVDRVGDVVRVLRPPGTINWKRGALEPVPVRLLHLDEELRVSFDALVERVEGISLGRRFSGPTAGASEPDEARAPALPDAVRAASWEELLFPLGWTYGSPVSGATSFLRPGHTLDSAGGSVKPGDGYGGSSGDGAKSAGVYDDGPEVMVVWSDAAGLPQGQGQRLTKFTVMALLHFPSRDGDRKKSMSAASADLAQAALARSAGAASGCNEAGHASTRSIWPASVLEAAMESLGGGWKSGSVWTIRTCDGILRRVSTGE